MGISQHEPDATLPPDFPWNLVALISSVRLSLRKVACVAVVSAARQEIRVRFGRDERTKSVVPHLRRSTACLTDPALPGWADFWCRPSGPGWQTPLSHVHSSLNLPQASRLLPRQAPRHAGAQRGRRDDRGEGEVSMKSGGWAEGAFIALGGPQAHDSSGRDERV